MSIVHSMYSLFKRSYFGLAIVVVLACQPAWAQAFASGKHHGQDLQPVEHALAQLVSLTPYPWDNPVAPLLEQYRAIELDDAMPDADAMSDAEKARYFIDDLNMHRWGETMSGFLDLCALLFSFQEPDYQKQHQAAFSAASDRLQAFRARVNGQVLAVHPGFDIHHTPMSQRFKGQGVKVAVFDLFEPELLARQRQQYPGAHIEPVQNFGDPVTLNHGNAVIDVILSIAPRVTIVPVSAEAATYNAAMTYIADRSDIHIVNMSRAFAENKGALDQTFSRLLQQTLRTRIVTKSMGNTGTDLDGVLTPLRQAMGLPPVGNIFAYDLPLITTFLHQLDAEPAIDHLLLGINLETFSRHIALSASIPGNNPSAISRSLGMPADSVYSVASGNFESGSSFAAPQLAGISALLWQAHRLSNRTMPASARAHAVVQAIQSTARAGGLDGADTGLGLPDTQAALLRILYGWSWP